jgi:hypothetical protein
MQKHSERHKTQGNEESSRFTTVLVRNTFAGTHGGLQTCESWGFCVDVWFAWLLFPKSPSIDGLSSNHFFATVETLPL